MCFVGRGLRAKILAKTVVSSVVEASAQALPKVVMLRFFARYARPDFLPFVMSCSQTATADEDLLQ